MSSNWNLPSITHHSNYWCAYHVSSGIQMEPYYTSWTKSNQHCHHRCCQWLWKWRWRWRWTSNVLTMWNRVIMYHNMVPSVTNNNIIHMNITGLHNRSISQRTRLLPSSSNWLLFLGILGRTELVCSPSIHHLRYLYIISCCCIVAFYYLVIAKIFSLFFQDTFLILCRSNLIHLYLMIDNHPVWHWGVICFDRLYVIHHPPERD